MVAAVLVATLHLGSRYALDTPDWQAPDEPAHFNYVAQIAARPGTLPRLEPGEYSQERLADLTARGFPPGESIDDQDIAIECYGPPDAGLLHADGTQGEVSETLVSDLLKSNCPVTGQPDWASVQVRYRGPRIDRAGLLRYLVSFRNHAGFHEQRVERIFTDLRARCAPRRLVVQARYTRRGGLDINPFRCSDAGEPADNPRLVRQ